MLHDTHLDAQHDCIVLASHAGALAAKPIAADPKTISSILFLVGGKFRGLLDSFPQNSGPVSEEARRKRIDQIKPYRFQPGISGNPGGRPKHDVASEIAQALFTNNPESIYEAFLKVLKKGSPYGFQVLADRAFGKLKEIHQIEHSPYRDASDEGIETKIAELKRKPGWPEPEPPTNETKPN